MDLTKSIDFLLENAGTVIQYRLRKEILNNLSKTEEENLLEQIYQTSNFKLVQSYVRPNGYIGSGAHSWATWRGEILHETPLQDGEAAARLLSIYAVPKTHPMIAGFINAMRDEETLREVFTYIPPEIVRFNTRYDGLNSGGSLMILIYAMQALLGYGDDEYVKPFREISLDAFCSLLPLNSIDEITKMRASQKYSYIEADTYFPCSYHLTTLAHTQAWRTPENIKAITNAINHLNEIMRDDNNISVKIGKKYLGPGWAFGRPIKPFVADKVDTVMYRRPLTEIAMLGVGENAGVIRESAANVRAAIDADGILRTKFKKSSFSQYPTAYVDTVLEADHKRKYALECDLTFWAVQFLHLCSNSQPQVLSKQNALPINLSSIQHKEEHMAHFNNYKHLFTPLKVGNTVFKSRVEFAPMVCDMTSGYGEPTDGYIDFVEKQAESGVAIIHLGATPVDQIAAADYRSEVDVTSEHKIQGLVRMAEAAHRHGAKLSVELVHAGRGADPELIQSPWALAPSNFPIPGRHPYVKEMDQHDIEQVIASYIDCSTRLQRCGFDGVLIHGAHGNLIAQFLSPLVNHRSDIYGGTFENRCRFPLMLLKAVRDAVGPDFLIELRISGDEIVDGGMRTPEVIEFLKLAQEYIDLVNVSAGLIVETRGQYYSMPSYFRPKGQNVPIAREIKQCKDIKIPISVVGSIVSAEMADAIIEEGSADMVAMARPLLADPDMLNKSYRGKPEKARPCLRCWGCAGGYGTHIHCAVNPQLARTYRYSRPWKADVKKKVVVVGGGIAGTQAARTLIERGHEVVLFEKSGELGGLLNDINKLRFKDDMLRYTDWLKRETLDCGADIRLNTEATAELVMSEQPDAIVVATGSVPAKPPIPGLERDNVYNVLDVDSGRREPKGKIVVCGGGLSGCESALDLAMQGNDVTVVDKIPVEEFALGTHDLTRKTLFAQLEEYNVKLIGSHLVREVSDEGVCIEDRDWNYTTLPADYVVEAFGMRADDEMKSRFFELIPDVYYVGDALEVKNIMHANFSAYDRCCNI